MFYNFQFTSQIHLLSDLSLTILCCCKLHFLNFNFSLLLHRNIDFYRLTLYAAILLNSSITFSRVFVDFVGFY